MPPYSHTSWRPSASFTASESLNKCLVLNPMQGIVQSSNSWSFHSQDKINPENANPGIPSRPQNTPKR
eukprot:3147298-Amphidinium_carterae.1